MKVNLLLIPILLFGLYACKNNRSEDAEYYKNGNLKKKTVYISTDKSRYREYEYFENERIKSLHELENGILQGRSFEYYSNGNIKSVFYYSGGKLNSVGRYYDEYGRLTDKGLFINDSMLVKEEFFYNGKMLRVNVFSNNAGNFKQTGSLLYDNQGLFGLDNSFYFITNSLDSIPFGDSLKVDVNFITHKDKNAHINLSLGMLNEGLQFIRKDKTYHSDSLSLSFYFKPDNPGYNLISGKLIYESDKRNTTEFVFYHDFLVFDK